MNRLKSIYTGSRTPDSRRNAMRTLRRGDTVGMLLLGKCHVGKTALVNRWINGTFDESYEPTVEDFHKKSINYKGQSLTIGLIDMTGTSDFPAMIDLYLNRVDSILLVYQVGDESSIVELTHLYERIKKAREQRPELFVTIIGTKIDTQDDICAEYRHNSIDKILFELGPGARQVLTSARHNLNINEAFESALGNLAPSIIPSEDTIKRLGELMKKNKRTCCFPCCI